MATKEEKEIGKAYADAQMKVSDLPGASAGPARKKTSDVEPKAEALEQDPQQEYLLKLQAYEQARSEWAAGRMSAAELEAHYAIMRRAKDIFISERALAARGIPRQSQLPMLEKRLEDTKLERDDVRGKMRDAKKEEMALKFEIANSRDPKAVYVAKGALNVLRDEMLPLIQERLKQVEARVQTYEKQLREERGRQGELGAK